MEYEPVIGLEVHVHLNTASKLFCGCRNVSEATEPNRFVCPVCMGFPGTLPVLNRAAVESAIRIGLALGCDIAPHATFSRKSYFYPDLPKGYQISQYDEPVCLNGSVHVFDGAENHTVQIVRAHLEEDAAKNIHDAGETLVDYTRSGTPLVEIVTAPDIRSPQAAKAFLEDLQRTMRYLGVSNANMEHGDLRVDANISLHPPGGALHPKTEVKNLNSFRAVERALLYEIERQSALWATGRPPTSQSTRGWDDARQETKEQRVKEEEADYRYFPEPDIPPLHLEEPLIKKLRFELPELPHDKEERFRREFRLPPEQARVLTDERLFAAFAENVFSELTAWNKERADVPDRDAARLVRLAANYLVGDIRTLLAAAGVSIAQCRISPENFAELIIMLHRGEINRTAVPQALAEMHRTGGDASTIVSERGLAQVSDDDELRRLAQNVLTANPAEVDKVRSGKTQVLQHLVGKIMAETQGRANPQKILELLKDELGL